MTHEPASHATHHRDERTSDPVPPLDAGCRSCGYATVGLSDASNCPECGTPVALSRSGDLLVCADPHWRARVSRGAGLLEIGGIPLMAFAAASLRSVAPTASFTTPVEIVPLFLHVVGTLGVIGVFLVTTPEPRLKGQESPLRPRRIARAGVAGASVAYAAFLLGRIDASPWFTWLGSSGVLWFGHTLLALGVLSFLRYQRDLSRRLPEASLVRSLRLVEGTVMASVLVIWTMAGLSWQIGLLSGVTSNAHSVEVVARVLALLASVSLLLSLIWLFALQQKFAKEVRAQSAATQRARVLGRHPVHRILNERPDRG